MQCYQYEHVRRQDSRIKGGLTLAIAMPCVVLTSVTICD